MSSKSLALPPAKTGPASIEAGRQRAFSRHAVPAEMREMIAAARKSGFLPASIKTDEQAIVAAMKGRELGLPPMQSFSAIHVIQGVPTLSASLMLGVAFKRLPGFDYAPVKWDATVCHLRGRRSAQHSFIDAVYTMEDATKAGLIGKDNWRKNPKAMLFARACGVLCRAVAPDTFMGLYTPEEMDGGAPPDAEPVEPVQPVDLPAEATVTTEPVTPAPAHTGPSIDSVMLDLAEASKTGGEVKAATAKLGYAGKKRSEWTLEMALAVAREAGIPGYVEVAEARDPGSDDVNPFAD